MDKIHEYEVRPCNDYRGVDLISEVLPFGRLWYGEPNAASNAVAFTALPARTTYCRTRRSSSIQCHSTRTTRTRSLGNHSRPRNSRRLSSAEARIRRCNKNRTIPEGNSDSPARIEPRNQSASVMAATALLLVKASVSVLAWEWETEADNASRAPACA